MYEAQRNHQLGTYVELPGKTENEDYEQLLQFLQNLKLKDIAILSLKYLEKYSDLIKPQPDFETTSAITRKNFINHP